MIILHLPLPPSVNTAFAGGRRERHLTMKTAAYRFWERQVAERFPASVGTIGAAQYGLWIDLPTHMRGDIDNRVKLLSDVLKRPKKRGDFGLSVVDDDDAMKALYVSQDETGLPKTECRVSVVRRADWYDFVLLRLG